jgi:uncharacterized metal-binding protein YceD (DUF177 family)
MTDSDLPFSVPFDLGTVRDRIVEVTVAPGEAQRAAIAHWLGVERLDALKARIVLSRAGADEYAYSGSFEADVVQACVVTLEPVPSHLSGEILRKFRVLPRVSPRRRKPPAEPPHAASAVIDLSSADDDSPELLDQPVLDLAGPLLEELSLALDPYPRAPGASFEVPPEPEAAADNPFAVLEKLKKPPANRRPPARPAAARQRSGKKEG